MDEITFKKVLFKTASPDPFIRQKSRKMIEQERKDLLEKIKYLQGRIDLEKILPEGEI